MREMEAKACEHASERERARAQCLRAPLEGLNTDTSQGTWSFKLVV